MEMKTLKFYNFSIEKLIELSSSKGKCKNKFIQFLAYKLDGEYEVMYLNYKKDIITFHMTEYGECLTHTNHIKKFALL